MSSTTPSPDAFEGAARAEDYIEEETIARPPRLRPIEDDIPVLPPPPPSAPDVPDKVPAVEVVVGMQDVPPAPSVAVPNGLFDAVDPDGILDSSILFTNTPAPAKTDRVRATDGFRGALARLGLPVKPSTAETERRRVEARRAADETTVRQATFTRAVSILVNNPKGGNGKTTLALLLAGIIAAIRGGSVAVQEVSDDPGTLTYRAEGTPKLGIGELVAGIDQVTTKGQLSGYTAPQTSFADVIGSTGRRAPLTGEAVVDVARVIDEFYSFRVMDSGNQATSSAFQGAVSATDVLVIPVMIAGDSILEALQLLEELRAAGGRPALIANTAIAVILHDQPTPNKTIQDEVTRLLHKAGIRTLLEVPFDAHLAERRQITLSHIRLTTRDAVTAVAASVIRQLQQNVPADPIRRA